MAPDLMASRRSRWDSTRTGTRLARKGGGAGEQQAQQVHGVFPADFAVVAEVLLDFLELAQGVAVEGLENHLGQETLADFEQFLRERSGFLHERRVEAFQDGWVCPQGHGEEFLEFPIAGLRGVVLELLGGAEEGPLEFGGREIDAAAVDVGFLGFEAVRPGSP